MSTSDNTPGENTVGDITPAEAARMDKLYSVQNNAPELTRSPADLDDLIRANAKAATTQAESSYWRLQGRYGWATAAAVVITTALFLNLPNDEPGQVTNGAVTSKKSTAQPATPVPATIILEPLAPESPIPEPTAVSATAATPTAPAPTTTAGSQVDSAVAVIEAQAGDSEFAADSVFLEDATEQDEFARKFQVAQPVTTVESSEPVARAEHLPQSAKATRGALSASKPEFGNCETIDAGPVERLCNQAGSYLLVPRQPSACGPFKLDPEAELNKPRPERNSDATRFIYSLNGQTYALRCEAGSWQTQSLARGR